DLFASLGHETDGVWHRLKSNLDHLIRRSHLKIQRLCNFSLQSGHIVVPDVAPVLAQMSGDPVRSRFNGKLSRADGVGMRATTRVANGSDVIDIHAEPNGENCRQANSLGLGDGQAFTRSAFATTSFARSCAMIDVRCLRS